MVYILLVNFLFSLKTIYSKLYSMTENEIKKLINNEIHKFVSDQMDQEMKRLLHSTNSSSREELIKTISNGLLSFSKTLWLKKDFWISDLKE